MPILARLAHDPYKIGAPYVVRAFVAQGLGKIGHESGIPVLGRFTGDDDLVVRWHVAVALGDIGHERGIPHLAQMVEDPVPFVRAHGAIALAQSGHEDA